MTRTSDSHNAENAAVRIKTAKSLKLTGKSKKKRNFTHGLRVIENVSAEDTCLLKMSPLGVFVAAAQSHFTPQKMRKSQGGDSASGADADRKIHSGSAVPSLVAILEPVMGVFRTTGFFT